VSSDQAQEHASKVLDSFHGSDTPKAPHEDPAIQDLLQAVNDNPEIPSALEASNSEGAVRLAFGFTDPDAAAAFQLASATGGAAILKPRPSYSTFKGKFWAYPDKTTEWVIQKVNPGWVGTVGYANSCCMRISRALNIVGPKIPRITKNSNFETELTPDGNRYIVKVPSMLNYLEGVWGKADAQFTKKGGDAFDPATHANCKNHKGIIGFVINSFTDAHGHCDLWNGRQFTHEMPQGWDGTGTNPHDYWELATEIKLWYLEDPAPQPAQKPAGGVPTPSNGGNV